MFTFKSIFKEFRRKQVLFNKKWIGKAKESYTDREIHVYIMGHSLGMTDKDILADFFYNNKNISDITIFYHNQLAYEQLVILLIVMFGKEFIIEQTGKEKIKFVELMGAVKQDILDIMIDKIISLVCNRGIIKNITFKKQKRFYKQKIEGDI